MDSQVGDTDFETVRYVFGAGFVFGVISATMILVLVMAVVTGSSALELLAEPLMLSVGAALLAGMIVGSALFLLAFPENRVKVPVISGDLTEEHE